MHNKNFLLVIALACCCLACSNKQEAGEVTRRWGDICLPTMHAIHSLDRFLNDVEDVCPKLEDELKDESAVRVCRKYIDVISSWSIDREISEMDWDFLLFFIWGQPFRMADIEHAAVIIMKENALYEDERVLYLLKYDKQVYDEEIVAMHCSLKDRLDCRVSNDSLMVERECYFHELEVTSQQE